MLLSCGGYLGDGLPILTVLMGVSMYVQQKMSPTGGDPKMEKMMMMMPVVFTVFFVNFPSGLVLYWLVNNVLSVGQQNSLIASAVDCYWEHICIACFVDFGGNHVYHGNRGKIS
jgi:YidC/Oxa1 family membrane protein insertase